MTAQEIIHHLGLKPLPEEGGFFKETYRDTGTIPHREGVRSYSTCIYYLITPEEFSGLHLVKSTEIFHFYGGDSAQMLQINSAGVAQTILMGNDLSKNEKPQVVVPANTWQGTRLVGKGEWALFGCTVAPGFEFADFVGGSFSQLSQQFPEHKDLIRDYVRGS